MILMMTVHRCGPGIVGDEVDLDGTEPGHVYRVLNHARGGLFTHLCDLEAVAMNVNGVVVPAHVGQRQAIVLSRLRGERLDLLIDEVG
jgi:hypothetical protein